MPGRWIRRSLPLAHDSKPSRIQDFRPSYAKPGHVALALVYCKSTISSRGPKQSAAASLMDPRGTEGWSKCLACRVANSLGMAWEQVWP